MLINRLSFIMHTFVLRFLFLFLCIPIALMPLDPAKRITQYSIQIWNMQSGLPGNTILDILQTKDGCLWLGTQNGLVRFDGVEFEIFNRHNTPLEDNVIPALYEDKNGNLWIGTKSEGLFYYKDGIFFSSPGTKALKDIRAIAEDRWENLWIGSLTEGLACLNNGKLATYTTKDGLPGNSVRDITKDGNQDLWITTETGIAKLTEPGRFHHDPAQHNVSPMHTHTTCLYRVETNELWIGTGDGLFQVKDGIKKHSGKEEDLRDFTVTSLFEDKDQNLWIGSDGGGLTRMNQDGEFSALHSGNGLADDQIYPIYEDKENNLWVGTAAGGLHQLKDSKFTVYTPREDLAHKYTNCVYQTRNGDILIGTDNGLNRLKDGIVTTEKHFRNTTVLSLFEETSGSLRVGTLNGLYRLKDGSVTTLTEKDGLSQNKINHIFEDKHGNTWIGTKNGLNRLDNKTGKISIFTIKQEPPGNHITFIFQDSKENIWICTDSGLNRLEDGAIITYEPTSGIKKTFQCAYEDAGGVLWFGTEKGLVRLKGNQPFEYTIAHGLLDNEVFSISEDNDGCLWLSGPNGVSAVEKNELNDLAEEKIDQLHPDRYNENDGMKSGWCTGNTCKTRARDGALWFPTNNGAAVILPHKIEKNAHPPTPIIKKLIVNGVPVNIHKYTDGAKPLVLGPGEKRLEFHYTGIRFKNPKNIRFKLKLDGYDEQWIDMGTARTTTYTHLSPKHYTFHVNAVNPGDPGNEESTSFSFILKPHFTQTAWFYILVVLSGLTAAFSLYRFRVRQLKHREKELGKLVELRTHDLKERNIQLENTQQSLRHSKDLIEAKNQQLEEKSDKLKEMDKLKSRFFANISHEFRTPLTLIMGPLEQMLSDTGDTTPKKKLNLMLRNSQRLLGLINQLLELSKFESGEVKLQARLQNVIPLLRGITANFEPLADRHELELTFQTETEDSTLNVEAGKLEDMVSNLLINAVKFTPPGGRITVSVREVIEENETFPYGYLGLSVSDTGPGISREQLAHIFDRFYQVNSAHEHRKKGTGIGLALVRELVHLHQGKIDVYSREGKGSEFIISLPLPPGVPADVEGVPAEPKASAPSESIPAEPKVSAPLKRIPELDTEPAGMDETGPAAIEKNIDSLSPGKEVVLVVEDSVDVREYVRGALEPGYTVIEAEDGEKGLQRAREVIPDLIISDIMMPGIDGYELCKALKGDIKTSHVPVILLTARAAEESIVQGLEIGVDDYITKPFSTRILVARVGNLIELRRQLQLNINREMTLQPARISVSPIDREFIKDLRGVISKNLSDPDFNVEQLARKLYMDRSTIYRKIHALTGESPTDFIRSCRLKRGAELLRGNIGTVLEVALEVGFSSANYFTKCFKKKFHQLPSSYQASESE